eukprot:gene13121-15429_t
MKNHAPLELPQQALYVFSGGPGSGKTTLLSELGRRGYPTVAEVARVIIREQMALRGIALPWKDKKKYKMLMLERSVESYKEIAARAKGPVFFDRGIPDTIAYSRLCGLEITPIEREVVAACPYHHPVFMFPPWAEIYRKDQERKQDWAEAVETYGILRQTYLDYGYKVLEVPKVSVPERSRWLLDQLGLPENVQI